MKFAGKKFVLVGGAGLIGSHTLDMLVKTDAKEIIIFDNFQRGTEDNISQSIDDPRVQLCEAGGDILHTDVLAKAFEGAHGVFHFAALWLLHCHVHPRSAFEVNVRGTFNVLEACVANKVNRLVYSSSASVYGDAESELMDEGHPYNNKNFYGATKIASEAMVTAFHYRYGLETISLRYMNVYGPRQDYKGAYMAIIMKMLDAIDQGKGPTIIGEGAEAFDFISVTDCALANMQAMKADNVGKNYNVGTGIKTSLAQLAQKLLDLTNSDFKINFIDRPQSKLVRSRIADPSNALDEIGFKAETNLDTGLKALIDWRANHKAQVEALRKVRAIK